MKRLTLALIKLYQETISKVLPSSCRFSPTCSQYTYEAIIRYGVFKGIWLGIKRLARCNPLHEGGYDPIPEKL
ncbi:MAG: membrane protein insertion efficiency factor YidD [Chloroflexota bacterium]